MFFTFIITTFKMTFNYSTEVSNLIDYDLILSNCDINSDGKYILDLHDDDKDLCNLIDDYINNKEHVNIIKKIVDTYGILNIIQYMRVFYQEPCVINYISYETTYGYLAYVIIYRNMITMCNDMCIKHK